MATIAQDADVAKNRRGIARPLPVEAEPGDRVTLKKTYCKICMTNCGLVAEVANDEKILKVRADREHPVTEGYSCPKGRATGQAYHLDRQVTRPMMRKGGRLVEVSWDEALDDIGARLRTVIDTHGPQAVGMYFGSGLGLDTAGNILQDAFHAALGGPPKYTPLSNDTTAKTMMAGAMAQFYGINPKTDYDACKMVIYVGTNPMVSHAHNTGIYKPGNMFKDIKARGGEIWVIDPLKTETADFAVGHIRAFPGKDYAVLAWVVRELLENGPCAPAQPVRHLDELRALLTGYDRAFASAVSGVPEEQMQALLDAIRKHGRVAIECGTGVGMSPGANMTVWMTWLIMILTGSMNQPGGLWMHPGSIFPFDRIVDHLPLLDSAFTPGPNVRPEVKGILGEWPCAALPEEIEQGHCHAFVNFGGALIRSFPDRNALTKALAKLDLLVSFDINHNELSDYVTHLLPTRAIVERNEFTRWDTLAWNVALQYSPALVKTSGERRSAWWAIAGIMRRAGLPVPEHVPHEDTEENTDMLQGSVFNPASRCTWDELKTARYIEFERELPAPWVDRLMERIGGWELVPTELADQFREFRAADEAELGQSRPLVFCPRRQRRKLNAQLDFLGETAECLIHPDTAAEHGVADGQRIRVFNKAGEIEVSVKLDPGALRGVCSIPHGHGDANVNNLTSRHDMDPLGGMAHYSAVPIAIEPAG